MNWQLMAVSGPLEVSVGNEFGRTGAYRTGRVSCADFCLIPVGHQSGWPVPRPAIGCRTHGLRLSLREHDSLFVAYRHLCHRAHRCGCTVPGPQAVPGTGGRGRYLAPGPSGINSGIVFNRRVGAAKSKETTATSPRRRLAATFTGAYSRTAADRAAAGRTVTKTSSFACCHAT